MEKVNLTEMSEDVRNIQKLDSHPTPGTMHADDLQQLFDKAGVDIKKFINETLIPELKNYLTKAIEDTDTRLTDSRKCNNEFDNKNTSKTNLGDDGDIFFKY